MLYVISADPDNRAVNYTIHTPQGTLSYKTNGNTKTTWLTKYMVKRDYDIKLIKKIYVASDHFFETPIEDIRTFANAAKVCVY